METAAFESKEQSANRWALMGLLRFAVLATPVAFTHFVGFGNHLWAAETFIFRALGGYPGVIGFFVVSGYCIAASLDRGSAGFYQRRAWRIYPTYIACSALAMVPYIVGNGGVSLPNGFTERFPSIATFAGCATIAENLFAVARLGFRSIDPIGQNWSLTCEIAYYILAPWLLRTSDKAILRLAAASVLVYYLHNAISPNKFSEETCGIAVPGLMWAWLAGFLFYRHRGCERAWCYLAIVVIPVATSNIQELNPLRSISLALTCLTFAPFVQVRLATRVRSLFVLLGDVSYPLYLSHFAVLWFVMGWAGNRDMSPYFDYAIYALCVAVAFVLHFAIEVPVRAHLRLRHA